MSEEERQLVDRYHQLIQEVDDARAAYYNRDAPVLSDAEYDKLYRELEDFEAHTRSIAVQILQPLRSVARLGSLCSC